MEKNLWTGDFINTFSLILSVKQQGRRGSLSLHAQLLMLFVIFQYGICIGQNSSFIINGNFSSPVVPNRLLELYYSAQGWNCTWICQFKNCQKQLAYWTALGQTYADCITQAIDLNSNVFNQNVSQEISLSSGLYSLSFNYYYPVKKATLKELKVFFNNLTVLDIKPIINASSERYYFQKVVNGGDGVNILKFQNLGYNDGYGFRINNVSLYNYILQNGTQNTIQNITQNITQDNTQNNTQNTNQNIIQNITQNITQNNTHNNTQDNQNINQNTTSQNNTQNNTLNTTLNEVESNIFLGQFVRFFFQQCNITNNVPGARVIFRSVLSFLINFDRLQLYIYHNRNYSPNAQLLLQQVNNFLNTKTNLVVRILSKFSGSIVQTLNGLANSNNYKGQYISYNSFSEEYQHSKYFDNINESFIYFFPFILANMIILNILFRILFQRPISLLFRKFDLWAIILILMFDGNIESTTFHTYGELNKYFSVNLRHKFLNIFMVMFFYLLLFMVFGFLFWVKRHYGKKSRYILDEHKAKMNIMWGIIIDRGIICFLFGIVHQLLINYPKSQLFFLAIVELVWIVKKIFFVYRELYQQKLLIIAGMLNGLWRILLQISFYLYQDQDLKYFVNKYIHSSLIYAIISTALLEIVIGLFYCFKHLFTICRINKQKIENQAVEIKQLPIKVKERQKPHNNLQLLKLQKTQVSYLFSYNGRPLKFHRNLKKVKEKIDKTKKKKVNIIG